MEKNQRLPLYAREQIIIDIIAIFLLHDINTVEAQEIVATAIETSQAMRNGGMQQCQN